MGDGSHPLLVEESIIMERYSISDFGFIYKPDGLDSSEKAYVRDSISRRAHSHNSTHHWLLNISFEIWPQGQSSV